MRLVKESSSTSTLDLVIKDLKYRIEQNKKYVEGRREDEKRLQDMLNVCREEIDYFEELNRQAQKSINLLEKCNE